MKAKDNLIIGYVTIAICIGFFKPFESNYVTAYVFIALAALTVITEKFSLIMKFLLKFHKKINYLNLVKWLIFGWLFLPIAIFGGSIDGLFRLAKTAKNDILK